MKSPSIPHDRPTSAAPSQVPQNTRKRLRNAEQSTLPDDGSLKNLWRLLSYTKPYKWWLIGAGITGLIRMILPLYMPIFFKNVMDNVIHVKGQTAAHRFETLFDMLPPLAALMLLHAIVTLARHYWGKVAETNAVRDIRYQLFDHIQRLSLEFHTQRPTGSIVTRVMGDVATAQDGL